MQNNGHTPEWTGPTVERVLGNGKRIYASAFKASRFFLSLLPF